MGEVCNRCGHINKNISYQNFTSFSSTNLPFVISYNNPEIHKIICQNMRIRQYYLDDTIFDSSKMENIDFLIYSGKVYLFYIILFLFI